MHGWLVQNSPLLPRAAAAAATRANALSGYRTKVTAAAVSASTRGPKSKRASRTKAEAGGGSHSLDSLKIAELNDILRNCGLHQGTGKAHKIATLSEFISTSCDLAQRRYSETNKRQAKSASEVYESFVPREVVSIDIGFRNLAFVHISRDGTVLDWRRVELLKEAVFEPWVLSSVVAEFVQNVLPLRTSALCTYLIEHQRFRSQGSAAVTDSVMVNNLVEALLYANLRHAGAHVEPVNPALVSAHWGFIDSRKNPTSSSFDEGGAEVSDKEQIIEAIVRMDTALQSQRVITRTQLSLIRQALQQKQTTRRTSGTKGVSSIDRSSLEKRDKRGLGVTRDLKRRLVKKERTIAMVQEWILSSLVSGTEPGSGTAVEISESLQNDIRSCLDAYGGAEPPLGKGHQLRFSAQMVEMLSIESKRDDLCDCVIQGVAWYRWQHYITGLLDKYAPTVAPCKM
ncbi:hypothetical protein GGI15_001911 [Coemansia interrupta]|uniref:Mitochondrial resolvase Ydc2 catalytic domain-containing protein n=1 Tax=Coemansia interrupta TaxID=1126814 RepID=A0A9W8HGK8_9FUNG|nr:hypothetical protein GGI15_001911 [Coemansia interrupta]